MVCRWGADAGIAAAKARQHRAASSDSESDSEVNLDILSISLVLHLQHFLGVVAAILYFSIDAR